MNDKEREQWVMNHEGLYLWWKRSRTSMRVFIRANRVEIDKVIDMATVRAIEQASRRLEGR